MTYSLRKKDVRSIIVTVIFVGTVWFGIAAVLYIAEQYWFIPIPIALFAISVRNQIKYYTTRHPKIIDAVHLAQKGLGKYLFLAVFIFSIIAATLYSAGVDEEYFMWVAWVIPIIAAIWIILRTRKFIARAKQEIADEERTKDAHDQPTP